MKKTRLIILSALSALALTSCSLFNDNDVDMKIENHFNSPEQASAPVTPKETVNGVGSQDVKLGDTDALLFKNVVYSNTAEGKIKNNYTTANGFLFNTNNGEDYEVSETDNNFDMYIPENLDRTQNHNVVLFIHGGAWVSGAKTHVNPYIKEFTKRGYIAATIEYTLLSKAALTEDTMDDDTLAKNRSISIFRDLDEIDACIYTMKDCLVKLGFSGTLSLVIGGASSGSHLAMLYSYSRGSESALGTPKFIINAVGPTDIKESVWKAFSFATEEEYNAALEGNDALGYTRIHNLETSGNLVPLKVSGAEFAWNEYQTMRIANGMCGFPYTPAQVAATTDGEKTTVNHSSDVYQDMVNNTVNGESLLSVTNYIDSSHNIPMICGYGGKDSIVGIAQYANLQHALQGASIEHEFYYFKECGHTGLENDETQYNNFMNKIVEWLGSK